MQPSGRVSPYGRRRQHLTGDSDDPRLPMRSLIVTRMKNVGGTNQPKYSNRSGCEG